MKHLFLIEKLKQADNLIRLEATGPPEQFAFRLGISVRSWYELQNLMKEMGAPISYSKDTNTYYYKEDMKFTCEICWKMQQS